MLVLWLVPCPELIPPHDESRTEDDGDPGNEADGDELVVEKLRPCPLVKLLRLLEQEPTRQLLPSGEKLFKWKVEPENPLLLLLNWPKGPLLLPFPLILPGEQLQRAGSCCRLLPFAKDDADPWMEAAVQLIPALQHPPDTGASVAITCFFSFPNWKPILQFKWLNLLHVPKLADLSPQIPDSWSCDCLVCIAIFTFLKIMFLQSPQYYYKLYLKV